MYLPRSLISQLYLQLVRTHHAVSPPVVILVALEPDALCACRIFASLLKRDYIPHKIKPISGYGGLAAAGQDIVRPMRLSEGGSGGVVVCLGVGGVVPLGEYLGLEEDDVTNGYDGVNVWVFDARRPYNLANVFGSVDDDVQTSDDGDAHSKRRTVGIDQGQLSMAYKCQDGGIIVFDDGDIQEELAAEREAYFELRQMQNQIQDMPEAGGDSEEDFYASDSEQESVVDSQHPPRRKRKSWDREDDEEDESGKENARPRQRRRSNSSSSISSEPVTPSKRVHQSSRPALASTPPSNQLSSQPEPTPEPVQPTARQLRRQFFRKKQKHDQTIYKYHTLGTSYSEPISSLMYSLASELGREDNDLLWLSIIGVSSTELYGRTSTGVSIASYDRPTAISGWTGTRGSRLRQLLRDEVRRLNPPELTETGREVLRGHAGDAIPIYARSPTDTSIRLSPEPRFLLIRHWSLYDSMLHSPYLAAKLHIWSEPGKRRLHKLLAKMGVSLTQCRQSYTHMDMDLKRVLRERLLQVAPVYGLDGLVPPATNNARGAMEKDGWGFVRSWGWKACLSASDVAVIIGAMLEVGHSQLQADLRHRTRPTASSSQPPTQSDTAPSSTSDDTTLSTRFYTAYDALLSPTHLLSSIPIAQSLARAILRTGTALLQKRQIRHLRAFRMAVLKEGPDLPLFCASGALTKLALWVGEAVQEVEPERKGGGKDAMPLVLGCLDESRSLFVVVGLGGGGGGSVAAASTNTPGGKDASEKKEKANARAKAREERRAARVKEKEKTRETRRERKAQARAARARSSNNDDSDGANDDASNDENESDATESEPSSSSSEDSDTDSDSEDSSAQRAKSGLGRNKFGQAFAAVAQETGARVRQDSFEHSVVEVRREDLSGFLEGLSMRVVVG